MELQSLVWQSFVDDAMASPRVLDFSIRVDENDHRQRWKAVPGPFLYDCARPVTTALTVCREIRFFALQAFSDTLAVERGRRRGIVRFDKDREIVAISVIGAVDKMFFSDFDTAKPSHEEHAHCIIPGFSDKIRNLAFKGMVTSGCGFIPQVERYPTITNIWCPLAMFRNVHTVFELVSWEDHVPYMMGWCANPDFPSWFAGIKAWPMVQFYGTTGHQALAELRATPVEQLASSDGYDMSEAESCKTEADEDGWIRNAYEDEADLGPGDDGSVCSPVDMESIIEKNFLQRLFCPKYNIENPNTECNRPMDLDHVDKWLDSLV
ncbi:hypothetical protein PspLS_01162 [Pyricularia sp. CBS 133598]|nr:hypothetical protein PspLS_01162 [Pyricularia sp. CBS 133598]